MVNVPDCLMILTEIYNKRLMAVRMAILMMTEMEQKQRVGHLKRNGVIPWWDGDFLTSFILKNARRTERLHHAQQNQRSQLAILRILCKTQKRFLAVSIQPPT